MKIKLNYNQGQPKEGTKQFTGGELTGDYITFAITSAYPEGLQGQLRRVFGRIQRKLDDAIETGKDDIELEEAEKDLIRDAFGKARFAAHLSKYINTLEEEIAKFDTKVSKA